MQNGGIDGVSVTASVPDGMRDGMVVSWAERVPLPPLPAGVELEPGEAGAVLDVPVVRLP